MAGTSSAERKLELWRALEAAVDEAATLPAACDAVGSFLVGKTGVAEALVVARGTGERHLNAGALGRPELSEEIRAVARVTSSPTDEWEETRWGDVLARPLKSRAGPVATVLLRRPGGGPSADDLAFLADVEERAGRLLRSAADRLALEERNLELATIYEIDHIRDEHLEFEPMLQRIMGRVLELIPAEAAAVALRSIHDREDGLRFFHRSRPRAETGVHRMLDLRKQELVEVVEAAFEARGYVSKRLQGPGAPTCDCMPLILDEEILGGFLLISPPGRRFSARDERLFRAVCSQTDTAIFEDLQRQRIKDVFKRYVSKDVFDQILHSEEDFLKGRRADVTCFFSDLRGFTSVSEKLSTDVVVEMLNEHLEAMTEVVFAHGGTVDKFIGDCVMAFFGAPIPQVDHAARAVRCAVEMRRVHQTIAQGWAAQGLPDVRIGIGLHTGPVFVGPVGGERLVSYTIIGDNVNLAARLEGESGPDEIIITAEVAAKLDGAFELEPRGEITVRGKTVAVEIFDVKGAKA